MTFYVIQTLETKDDGSITITWHKHLYCFFDDAVQACKKKGSSACVLQFEQINCFTYESITKESGDGKWLLEDC